MSVLRCERIGARLSEARLKAGLSGNALAKAAGLNHTTVQDIEKGRRYPAVDTVERLSLVLGVSPSWLAYGEGLGPQAGDGA